MRNGGDSIKWRQQVMAEGLKWYNDNENIMTFLQYYCNIEK